MNPKKTNHSQGRFFEARIPEQLNPNHELFIFSRLLNWEALEETFKDKFVAEAGAPAKPVRLIVGARGASTYLWAFRRKSAHELLLKTPIGSIFVGTIIFNGSFLFIRRR